MSLHEHFSDCDELRQAAHRTRFMTPAEILMGDDEIPFAVNPYLVDMHVAQCQADLHEAKRDLRKHLGQLVYLQNLAKSPEQQQESGENTDPCLICMSKLGREWGVFSCGHPYCVDCIVTLLQRNPSTYIYSRHVTVRCPLCREPTISTEINYIRSTAEDDSGVDIKGSYSTKVSAVVKTLLSIRDKDPGAKALVFSTWKEILDLIGRALHDNDVTYRVLVSNNKLFQSNLDEFKTRSDVNVLLLPFHSGSKGLNIVEATHVLLVEPLLNVGTELQAIGRVHRMGQTKPTFVHRFIIENTVEEKLRELLASRQEGAELIVNRESDSTLTVADIRSLLD